MPTSTAPVRVEALFNSFLSCNRPHESNVSLVGAPLAEIIPTAAPISLPSCQTGVRKKVPEPKDKSDSSSESSKKSLSPKPGVSSDEKKQRRREQNRRAAVKSRKRKKVYMQELEAKVKKLKESNEELLARMQQLIQENEKLKRARADEPPPLQPQSPSPKSETDVDDNLDKHTTPIVKSESAELVSQQMELTVGVVCLNWIFVLQLMIGCGNLWTSWEQIMFSPNQSGPSILSMPAALRYVISSLNKMTKKTKFHQCAGSFAGFVLHPSRLRHVGSVT
mmetsp:Transcript_17396/g.33018  ORF Transcript_17396/g.33018 Transcript_17396/m.33018 type:complete len:279 (-) Transcript_17396:524-1360(-)